METRNLNNVEIRVDIESRMVEGYAVVFESESVDMGFHEVIHRGAITDETIEKSDVFARLNHDDSKILARSRNGNGSLSLSVDENGVYYRFEAPKTALGDELLEYLNRGDITSSSFAFSLNSKDKTAEKWRNINGVLHRDIYKIDRLYDIAPVFRPAYEATSCTKRFNEVKNTVNEINEIFKNKIEEINNL